MLSTEAQADRTWAKCVSDRMCDSDRTSFLTCWQTTCTVHGGCAGGVSMVGCHSNEL